MSFLSLYKKHLLALFCCVLVLSVALDTVNGQSPDPHKIGVLFIHHGGMDTNKAQYMWDAAVTMFTYDPNHPVYKLVIWDHALWHLVLDSQVTAFARSFMMKYDFSYERVGGVDHNQSLTDKQIADMKSVLDTNTYGLTFEVDWASYIVGDYPAHYIWPRFVYHGPDGPGVGDDVTYCGENEKERVVLEFDTGTTVFTEGTTVRGQSSGATATIDAVTVNTGTWAGGNAAGFLSLAHTSAATVKFQDGEQIVDNGSIPGSATAVGGTRWASCDPERFNVDGPLERLLNKGVSRIIVVDLTMSGIRFSKTFWPLQVGKKLLKQWNADHGTSIPFLWVNDYSNLMERSYPLEPEGWTRALGYPTKDSHILLQGGPNPLAEDSEIAELHIEGIEAAMSDTISDAETGVILMNHSLYNHTETYDPKINDTISVNENIQSLLLSRHPAMDPDNIVGGFDGGPKVNPENGLLEYTREQRGDRLGTCYLYESDKQTPANKWGYRYWDALEYLKDRGVKHIAVGFTQVCTTSVLDLIEVPNTVGKEIGIKTWAQWATGDYEKYPDLGHPFSDYWGNWVYTECGGQPCCFTMGGCGDPSRPYPPPRQVAMDVPRDEFDPSLAFDLSDYGHLGYDPALGPPNPDGPVQDQYRGTWAMYSPPDDDPRVGRILAKHVLNAAINPMVYVTNGEREGIAEGENVTFAAHVTGGGVPEYTYEWSVKETGDANWSIVGGNSSTWTWNPINGDAGTYDARCTVTDSQGHSGKVTWKGFIVSSSPPGVPIPTLSEWGMIILMTIFVGVGALILLGRKRGSDPI